MSTDNRPQGPAAGGRSASTGWQTGWQPARLLAVLLLLVGLGGYVVAAAADSSVTNTPVADDSTLGQQDPASAARALSSHVTTVQRTYDTYAAASLAVVSARRDVNKLIDNVRSPTSRNPGAAGAKDLLSKRIAAYGAAVERENVARQAYAVQLAHLMAEVHR